MVYKFDTFEVDDQKLVLLDAGVPVQVEPEVLRLLLCLIEDRGRLVGKKDMLEKVWPGAGATESTLNAAIASLRNALNDHTPIPRIFLAIPSVGCRFTATVTIPTTPREVPAAKPEPPKPRAAEPPVIAEDVVIGHYRVLRKIGSGGMATVYEAEDGNTGRRVALKFLPEALADNAHSIQRFRVEARAAAALSHPNICAVYQVDEFAGRQCIAMELLQGQTLKETIDGKPLPLDTVLDLALQIAAALQAAHAKGIVHRDIKPTNVFITTEGQVKIFDFGIAKLTSPADTPDEPGEAAPKLTKTGIVLGSNGYAAPEQIRTEAIDQRADLFAFGCVLYEMITGKRAFERKTKIETMVAVLSGSPEPISRSVPGTPAALQRIVTQCIEKKPAQRFQTSADLAAALEAVKNPGSSGAAPAEAKSAWGWARSLLGKK